MKKVFVYLVYNILAERIYKLLDEGVDMITQDIIQNLALEIFEMLEEIFILKQKQIQNCCTLWLDYSLDDFVEAVMKGISEEGNDLFERAEQKSGLLHD